MKNIYFSGLGYRDPIADCEQIIWFLSQMAKPYKKGHLTAYWASLKQGYSKHLLEMQAFELLQFLTDKTTSEQEKRRIANQIKAKAVAQLEMDNLVKELKEKKDKATLLRIISLN